MCIRDSLLREESLAAGHVQAGVTPRDEPLDTGERIGLVLLRGIGEDEAPAFDTPEPSVLELPAMLGGRGIRKHRGDRGGDRQGTDRSLSLIHISEPTRLLSI